jgi:uncharacterized DUF497 family protein
MIEPRGFDWDDDQQEGGNTWHICARRNISQADVESVFDNNPLVLRERSDGPNPYYCVIGRDRKGRLLRVHGIYFQDPPKQFWFRPVSAFSCGPKLERRYLQSGRE